MVKRLFVLPFEISMQRVSYNQYFLSTIKIKGYNVMIDEENFLDHPVKNDLSSYDNIKKTCTWSRRRLYNWLFTTLSLFQRYKVIAIDYSKQQALDADPKVIQQIDFTGHIDRNATRFPIIEKEMFR